MLSMVELRGWNYRRNQPVRCAHGCGHVIGEYIEIIAEPTAPGTRVNFGGALDPDRFDVEIHEGLGWVRPHVGDVYYQPFRRRSHDVRGTRITLKPWEDGLYPHGNTQQRCRFCGEWSEIPV